MNPQLEMDILWNNPSQQAHAMKPVDRLPLKVVQLLTLQLCLIISSVLNGIVAFVLVFRNKQRRGGSVFVGSLTSMNFILSILLIPTSIIGAAEDNWPFGQSACSFIAFVQLLELVSANQTLALIAVDRYYAIVRPLSYENRVTKVRSIMLISTCWIISLFLSLPPFWGWSHFAYHPHVYVCSVLWSKHPIYSVFVLMVVYVIPLIGMSLAYLNVYWAAKLQERSVNVKLERDQHVPLVANRKKAKFLNKLPWVIVTYNTPQKAKRTILIFLGSFQLFWSIYGAWIILEFSGFHYPELAFTAFFANIVMVTITPIFYGLMNHTIRRHVKRTFCRRRRRTVNADDGLDGLSTASMASFLDYSPRNRTHSWGVESSELIKMNRSLSQNKFASALTATLSPKSKKQRKRMKKSTTAPAGINIILNPGFPEPRERLPSAPDAAPDTKSPLQSPTSSDEMAELSRSSTSSGGSFTDARPLVELESPI